MCLFQNKKIAVRVIPVFQHIATVVVRIGQRNHIIQYVSRFHGLCQRFLVLAHTSSQHQVKCLPVLSNGSGSITNTRATPETFCQINSISIKRNRSINLFYIGHVHLCLIKDFSAASIFFIQIPPRRRNLTVPGIDVLHTEFTDILHSPCHTTRLIQLDDVIIFVFQFRTYSSFHCSTLTIFKRGFLMRYGRFPVMILVQ